MCTSFAMHHDTLFFGRNMDLEYSFQEKLVITPRQYCFTYTNNEVDKEGHAMIGIASVIQDYPLYAEAMNEKGVVMAGLNFPDNAYYPPLQDNGNHISPFELIPWILRRCSNMQEVRQSLSDLVLCDRPFSASLPLAPLHWMISDAKESIVVESMQDGLHIHENPFHVLTNNPPFQYHYWNLHNLANLSIENKTMEALHDLSMRPYAQGMGAMGLPGDASSASRFLKTWFHLVHSPQETNRQNSIMQCFHILDSVAMLKGSVMTAENKMDITRYSCCMDVDAQTYYVKTYDNPIPLVCDMKQHDLVSQKLITYEIYQDWNPKAIASI